LSISISKKITCQPAGTQALLQLEKIREEERKGGKQREKKKKELILLLS